MLVSGACRIRRWGAVLWLPNQRLSSPHHPAAPSPRESYSGQTHCYTKSCSKSLFFKLYFASIVLLLKYLIVWHYPRIPKDWSAYCAKTCSTVLFCRHGFMFWCWCSVAGSTLALCSSLVCTVWPAVPPPTLLGWKNSRCPSLSSTSYVLSLLWQLCYPGTHTHPHRIFFSPLKYFFCQMCIYNILLTIC